MKALVRIQAKYRPYSGDLQGFRIQAAIPNLAAKRMLKTSSGFRATNEDVPAFRAPFLIRESMDYANDSAISKDDMDRFKKALLWEGFDEVEMIVKPTKQSQKLTPEVQAKLDKMLAALGLL